MDNHKLVMHSHHRSTKSRSTQTLITDPHDSLLQDLKDNKDTALLVLDQSKAYNLMDHDILLRKCHAIGCEDSAIDLLRSYLKDR